MEREMWRPIESAPRDGTFYLAVNEINEMNVENRPKGCAPGRWWKVGKEWSGSANFFNATHWMPLPTPPENIKK